MTFASDKRGRIPFAFLGALLLLSSSFYAVSFAPPPATEPVTDEVVSDVELEARLALDAAVRDAGRAAAAEPVLEPSDTGYGTILSNENTFRDALELRIASGARTALAETNASRDSVEATVTLPPITDPQTARQALSNVSVRSVSADRYRVRVEGLQVTVTRHDRLIDRFRYNATLTMAMPALELHDRTNRYESRLNAGITKSGLTQDLTARLFPIVWMRGYAQYGGAPIENVLANRHVEVMANDALLAQQAAVFGVEDPDGRNGTTVAATEVAARDVFLGAEETVKSQLGKPQGEPTGAGEPAGSPDVPIPSVVDSEQSVDADHAADTAYLAFVDGRDGRSLADTVERVYRGDVRVQSRASRQQTEYTSFGSRPDNATELFADTSTERWHDGGDFWPGHGSTLRTYRGRVIEEQVTTHYWSGNGTLETTQDLKRTTYQVTLDLDCRYQAPGVAPNRPDGQCPFGEVATDRLRSAGTARLLSGSAVEERSLAAVSGGGDSGWRTVHVEPPEAVTDRATSRTADLRRAVQEVSVSVETRSVASSTNPAAELASAIQTNRHDLLDTPNRYGSAAERAVTAARHSYFDRVTEQLESRTPLVQRAQNAFADQLQSQMVPTDPPERSQPSADAYVSSVDGGPAYLSVEPPSGHDPTLAARNVNLFTVPYGDAADGIAERVGAGDSQSVSIRTGAQTLAASERTDHGDRQAVRSLRRDLDRSVDYANDRFRSVLAPSVGVGQAHQLVQSANTEWSDVHSQALAVADGRLAAAVAERLPRSLPATERDRLRVALRIASAEARSETDVQVSQSLVEAARTEVTTETSGVVEESAKAAGTAAGKRAWSGGTGKTVGSLPAGLPLLPVPGSWYATANAWTVEVQGTYDRFAVRSRRAAPGRGANGTVEYVRENTHIRTDIDADGTPEVLGTNRALSLEARTGVVIVVPPGGTGVGDTDGQAVETSPGW
ncbi:DUF7286 family protein [Halodesulfurarchaeum sp.]|uniref:DUF7286 family protein n=1 Tax=Halodesulfurarchaeum sp. TaxID=1980530 RepID=UPI001BBFEF6C|nr:hypothetical protein [Halodesulfurarchaeum sp.]